MIDIDGLNPHNFFVAQGYDGSNNMLGKKSSVVKRILDTFHMATENYCFSYSASLPCKAIYNDIDFMTTFYTHMLEIIN